jgi:hypothetical protein
MCLRGSNEAMRGYGWWEGGETEGRGASGWVWMGCDWACRGCLGERCVSGGKERDGESVRKQQQQQQQALAFAIIEDDERESHSEAGVASSAYQRRQTLD